MRRDGKKTHKVKLLATNLNSVGTKIYNFDGVGYSHALFVMSSSTAVNQTVNMKIQDSEDGSSFSDVSGTPIVRITPPTDGPLNTGSRTILVNLNRTRRYVRAQFVFQGSDAANAKIYSVVAILQNQAQSNGEPFTVAY